MMPSRDEEGGRRKEGLAPTGRLGRRVFPSFLLPLSLFLLSACGSIQLARPLVPAPATEAPAPPLVRVWETDVEAAFGPDAAVVGGGAVAVGTRNGKLVVLDAATGKRLGALSFGSSIDAGIVLSPDGQTAYVPVARGRDAVVAQTLRSGDRRWRWRSDSTEQTADAGLALVGNTVVAPLHDGTVVGLDAQAGTERWRIAGTPGVQYHAAPVALAAAIVGVADDRGEVRALDASTGRVLWTAQAGAPVYAAPVLAEGRLLVATTRGTLAALDASTGRALWAATLDPTGAARVSSAGSSGSLVVAGLTDGRVVALDASTGTEAWTWTGTGAVVGAPFVSGGVVYVGTMDKRLVALDVATGAETWSTETRGRIKSAFAVAGGRLVVLTEPRHVAAFETAPATAAVLPRP